LALVYFIFFIIKLFCLIEALAMETSFFSGM
jgi:hypothetical protein